MAKAPDLASVLGAEVKGWSPPERPVGAVLRGRFAVLEKLSAEDHCEELFKHVAGEDQLWTYMPYGPFATITGYRTWMDGILADEAHQFYAVRNLETGRAEGVASYLRINPQSGSIEVGHINFSPALQRTRAATEAMYLMMRWAFEAGYRRYEWKCNARNIASRRAAQRLGLSYEGVFRQATVAKGFNRDTAWFAAIDSEWHDLARAFETWLSSDNFADSVQKQSLSDLTRHIRVSSDPVIKEED